jgi:hypothetical protein
MTGSDVRRKDGRSILKQFETGRGQEMTTTTTTMMMMMIVIVQLLLMIPC